MLVFNHKNPQFNERGYQRMLGELLDRRNLAIVNQADMLRQSRYLSRDVYARNAASPIIFQDFWREVDRRIIEVRQELDYLGFIEDIEKLSTPVSVAKTAKIYTVGTEKSDNTQISMDGQAPRYFDHTSADNDGDPIPIFTNGFGINWRYQAGLREENIDILMDSQRKTVRHVFENIADYYLYGSERARAGGYDGQGIINHRNTQKINLGAGGFNIDLVNSTNDEIIDFFSKPFSLILRENKLTRLDVVWVSPEIMTRFKSRLSMAAEYKSGSLLEEILRFSRIREFKELSLLQDNEFFGYNRSRDDISPLTAAPVSVYPLARKDPMDNFNFLVWGATGLQIKADVNGRSSVFYAGNLF